VGDNPVAYILGAAAAVRPAARSGLTKPNSAAVSTCFCNRLHSGSPDAQSCLRQGSVQDRRAPDYGLDYDSLGRGLVKADTRASQGEPGRKHQRTPSARITPSPISTRFMRARPGSSPCLE
jgi:hypothetical protein